jgi:hypothetical protein
MVCLAHDSLVAFQSKLGVRREQNKVTKFFRLRIFLIYCGNLMFTEIRKNNNPKIENSENVHNSHIPLLFR